MSNQPQERVEPCFRCGQAAEQPAIGQGHVAGQEEERVPLCVQRLEMLLADPAAFWDRVRRREGTLFSLTAVAGRGTISSKDAVSGLFGRRTS
jgi:hypothetical protein